MKIVKILPKHVLVYKCSPNIKNCCAFDVNIFNKYIIASNTISK
jgi:hypothetical protein